MLDINLEFIRGMLFVRLDGKLDKNTYTKFTDCLDTMIHEKGLLYFVVNLENLEEIDEEGIQAILNQYFDITLHDGKLVICGYHHQFHDNLEIKNAFEQIEHTNNELGALKLIQI